VLTKCLLYKSGEICQGFFRKKISPKAVGDW